MTKFGERIRELATKIGKEEQDIAKDLGLTKSQLSHYINGRRKVPSELLQKIVDIYKINPQFLFDSESPLYKEKKPKTSSYFYLPANISAGLPIEVDGITEAETISIPDFLMGKWAGRKDIFIMRVNGDSMNKIIPHNSLIAVKQVELSQLRDGDIVVYSDDVSYAVKHFYNDKANERLIFRPNSNDKSFTDYIVSYENAQNVKIHGKVVIYVVEMD